MSNFAEYVTSTAFNLSLSRPQIECLCQIEQNGGSWQLLTTSYALQRKGLIERSIQEDGTWRMKLTEAGSAVIPLLKLAGLWVDCKTPEAVKINPPQVRAKAEV